MAVAVRLLRATRRALAALAVAAAVLVLVTVGWAMVRGQPQDLPWTPLDLGDPVGDATGRKLTALADDLPRCEALMTRAGVRYATVPPRRAGDHCGYDDGVRLRPAGARRIGFRPDDLATSCTVAAALAVWEWNHLQPAARRLLGTTVTGIDHAGSYSCRRMYGRSGGGWSEHATADAVDVTGFRLADGRRISVARDWAGDGDAARFLHEVRDGACRLFATTLSPDYNAAHRDHLHLDQASRGTLGWRACR